MMEVNNRRDKVRDGLHLIGGATIVSKIRQMMALFRIDLSINDNQMTQIEI